MFLIGFTHTGHKLLNPKGGGIIFSKDVLCIESIVYSYIFCDAKERDKLADPEALL